jgi:hypothetical protein
MIMCEYSLQNDLGGLKQHIRYDFRAIVCIICIVY